VRVEHVYASLGFSHSFEIRSTVFDDRCRRLSLTCLCYLWQRDQDELLSEMVAAGMESVLIKVAGIGLSEKHLGKTLAEMQPTLQKLVSQSLDSLSHRWKLTRVLRIPCMDHIYVEKEANTRR